MAGKKEKEPERKASEELMLLSTAAKMTRDAIIITDLEGKVLEINEAAVQFYDVKDKQKIIGMPIFEDISPELEEKAHDFFKKILNKGEIKSDEFYSIRKDGRKIYLDISATVMRDSHGKKMGIVIILRDISEQKQTEKDLEESEEKYRTLVEDAGDGIAQFGTDGKITYINKYLLDLGNYQREEVVGHDFTEFVPEEHLPIALKLFEDSLQGIEIPAVDIELKTKDGKFVPVDYKGSIIYEEGEIVGVRAIIRDITERKRIEEELKDKSEFLNAVVNSTSEGIFVLDEDLNYVFINPASGRILGHDPEEWIGKQAGSNRHPDDTETSAKAIFEVLENGKSECVIRVKSSDGKYHDLSIGYTLLTYPDRIQILGVVNDVTEHRKAAKALRASEEKYRRIVENINDAMYLHDFKGRIMDVNKNTCRLLGYKKSELVGKTLDMIACEEEKKLIKPRMKKLIEKGNLVFEGEHIRKDGTHVPLSISARVVSKEGKGIVQSFVREITELKKIEEALKESEEKFRMIMTSSPYAISVSDLTGKTIETNQRAIELFGFKNKKDALGRSAFEYIAPKDRPEAIKNIEKTLKTGVARNIEYTLIRKDGSEFQGELSMSVIRNAEGKPSAFVAMVHDITERKLMEKELRESEEKYSAVVENSKDAIAIVQDGIIKFANTATVELTGHNFKGLIGHEFMNFVSPEYKDAIMQRYKDRLRGKKVPSVYDMEIIKKDGSMVPIEVSNTIITYEGKEATLSVVRDITERKIMEEKWRSIAENAPDIVMMLDLKDRITFINRTVPGLESSEVIGKSQYDYILPEYHDHVKKVIKKVVRTGMPDNYSVQGTGPDGSISWYETQVGPLRDGNNVNGVILFIKDVTDRKKSEEALKESEEKYRSLFEFSPESITIIDLEGTILECNDATTRIAGIKKKDMIGKSFMTLGKVFDEDMEKYQTIFGQIFEGKDIDSIELKVGRVDGGVSWIEAFPTPLKKDGEIYAIQVITRDVTERKRTEMEMKMQLLKFDIEEGNIYIVKETRPDQSIEIFNELLEVGYEGHIVSRAPAKHYSGRVKQHHDFLWISERESHSSLPPKRKDIDRFIEKMSRSQVILFEGLDYMISKMGIKESIAMIQSLREIAYMRDHIIILSVDPSAMDEKELRKVEKETMEVASHMALGKVSEKLLDILRFVNKENLVGIYPSYSDVESEHELSKPTVRKRIKDLQNLGCVKIIEKGRNKYLEITEKGKTYMVLK